MHLNLPGWRTGLVIYVSVAHGSPGCGWDYGWDGDYREEIGALLSWVRFGRGEGGAGSGFSAWKGAVAGAGT